MREVVVVGAGCIPCGAYPDAAENEMLAPAIRQALDDSGAEKKHFVGQGSIIIDRFYNEQQMFENWFASGSLELPLSLCAKVLCGGASAGAALRYAYYAIAAGDLDVCLIAAVSKESHVKTPDHLMFTGRVFDRDFETPHGVTLTGVNGGMVTQRYLREYGAAHEKLVTTAVRNRAHAAMNPDARYREPLLTAEDIMNSRVIADPVRLLECAGRDDGAAAIIVAAAERASDFKSVPIHIKGLGEFHDSASFISENLATLPGIGGAVRRALDSARISVSDIDVAEIYAPFAVLDAITLEEMGLCGRGQAGDFVAEGNTHIGGKIPINPSGGLTSRGHPPYASELYGIVDIVRQLRGEAGERQVRGATIGAATGAHSGANGATVEIFERRA